MLSNFEEILYLYLPSESSQRYQSKLTNHDLEPVQDFTALKRENLAA